MALCDSGVVEFAAREVRRDMIFRSLHRAHAAAWVPHAGSAGFKNRQDYTRFYAWRTAWWKELEKAFPDKIKNGVVTCPTHSVPSTSLPVSKLRGWSSEQVEFPSSNGLFPEAIPCMQPPAIPGTFPEATKGFGLTCSLRSKPILKASEPPGKWAP